MSWAHTPSVAVLASLCSSCPVPFLPWSLCAFCPFIPDPFGPISSPAHSLVNPVSFPKENLASPSPNNSFSETPVFLLHRTYQHQGPLSVFQDLGFEPRESHTSAQALILMDPRDTQGWKPSGLGFHVDGPREGRVKEATQATCSVSQLVDANVSFWKLGRRSSLWESHVESEGAGGLPCSVLASTLDWEPQSQGPCHLADHLAFVPSGVPGSEWGCDHRRVHEFMWPRGSELRSLLIKLGSFLSCGQTASAGLTPSE